MKTRNYHFISLAHHRSGSEIVEFTHDDFDIFVFELLEVLKNKKHQLQSRKLMCGPIGNLINWARIGNEYTFQLSVEF